MLTGMIVISPPNLVVQAVCNQAVPNSLILPIQNPGHVYASISEQEEFRRWLEGYGPDILNVHGSAVSDPSVAAWHIFLALEAYKATKNSDAVILEFSFADNDVRCQSVTSMLDTMLATLFTQHRRAYDSCSRLCESNP